MKTLLDLYRAILINFLLIFAAVSCNECFSCFTSCKLLPNFKLGETNCDCTGETTCKSTSCFVKVEIFHEEFTAIIQKGCVNHVYGGKEGCQYTGQYDSIYCSCTGHLCNTKEKFNSYETNRLPTVDCCECSESHRDYCPNKNCLRQCSGNYCLIDFDGVEQGCGVGYPRLQDFLRTKSYIDWYQTSNKILLNGCVCTNPTGSCNELNKTRTYQLNNVINRRLNEQNYCYSLHYKSHIAFSEEVFKSSETCEGQFCFLSLTTSELLIESTKFEKKLGDHKEFIGTTRPNYELLAGCLKIDNDQKVTTGCTTEFVTTTSEPLLKHCICDSHLCNFYDLLSDKIDSRKRNEPKFVFVKIIISCRKFVYIWLEIQKFVIK
ncbi:unnamed protein product [Dracunculus medinensis]|uniref:Activin_recp domain-containing protein n=1 Tax=Dracunculus medinensis TaxID=318479 RepID=A0A0N4U6N7_DRAME|nr:unnamed protein product [Dracunculus medinensis]